MRVSPFLTWQIVATVSMGAALSMIGFSVLRRNLCPRTASFKRFLTIGASRKTKGECHMIRMLSVIAIIGLAVPVATPSKIRLPLASNS
jgi:hypothetical protein